MSLINYSSKEITCKIVYYGCGRCGKTTNLQYVYSKIPQVKRSSMVSLATEKDRTLFFDFLPLDLGEIAGYKTRFQLYTVPGQVFYNSTRKLVLQGVDGIVFVADSQVELWQENIDSLGNLQENMRALGLDVNKVPLVMQYNKRDLPNIVAVADLDRALNFRRAPYFESRAVEGVGVFDTLKAISALVLQSISAKYKR
ncbi:gliding-motility protein MglA [bacterium]|nr:gliding-motility protein MglA [bacterium]